MQKKAIMAPDKGLDKRNPVTLIDDRAWADGFNVTFGPGYVQKAGGWQKFLNRPAAWQTATAYDLGAYTVPTTANRHVYQCTTAGIGGTVEPTWPTTAGGTVTDGTAVWTEVGLNKLDGQVMALDNYFKYDGDEFLIAITNTSVYSYDATNRVFIDITGDTPLTGTIKNPVIADNAQNYFVFTNGVDPVKYWDGIMAAVADLPGLTDCEGGVASVRATCLLYFENFLLLGGTVEDGNDRPQRVRTSCLGDIMAWKNVEGDITKQQAGYFDMTDDVSWVQCMRPFKNFVVVYKDRAIQVIYYVGGTLIWDKRPAIIGTGVIAPKALIDLGDEHIFVGPDNFYSFDLIEPKIAGDDIAQEFFRQLDPDKKTQITGFFIEEVPELFFAYPSIDSPDGTPDKCVAYNVDTKAWAFRDMPMSSFGYYNRKEEILIDDMEFTIDSWNTEIDSSVNLANAPLNLSADASGEIYELTGHSFDGADIASTLTTKLFDMDDPIHIKRLLRVQFMISREGPYYLPVYVGTAANVDEPVTWYGPYNMSLDRTYPPWIDMDISARYLCLRLGTVNADEPYKITGYIMYYELRGEV